MERVKGIEPSFRVSFFTFPYHTHQFLKGRFHGDADNRRLDFRRIARLLTADQRDFLAVVLADRFEMPLVDLFDQTLEVISLHHDDARAERKRKEFRPPRRVVVPFIAGIERPWKSLGMASVFKPQAKRERLRRG